MQALRKMQEALAEVKNNPRKDISVSLPDKEDYSQWEITVLGPEGTPYYGGRYTMELKFGNNFPIQAPSARMKTKIYHLNVNDGGKICVDLLGDGWTPKSKVSKIIDCIYNLFIEPIPESASNDDAFVEFVNNREEYNRKAAQINKQFAIEKEKEEDKFHENNGDANNKNNGNGKTDKQVSFGWCLSSFCFFVLFGRRIVGILWLGCCFVAFFVLFCLEVCSPMVDGQQQQQGQCVGIERQAVAATELQSQQQQNEESGNKHKNNNNLQGKRRIYKEERSDEG